MKYIIFVFVLLTQHFSFSQSFIDGATGYTALFGRWSNQATSCAIQVGFSGILGDGENQTSNSIMLNNDGNVEFVSKSTLLPLGFPSFFGCLFTYVSLNGSYCAHMCRKDLVIPQAIGIDMSGVGNSKIVVSARASETGAKLMMHIGYANSSPYPESSTFNMTNIIGAPAIFKEIILSTAMEEYLIDFADTPTDLANWLSFDKRNQINIWGVDSHTPNVKYEIGFVKFGSDAQLTTSLENNSNFKTNLMELYPNPAYDKIYFNFQLNNNVSQYYIVDMNGIIVKKDELKGGSDYIDIQFLKPGIYAIKVEGASFLKFVKI